MTELIYEKFWNEIKIRPSLVCSSRNFRPKPGQKYFIRKKAIVKKVESVVDRPSPYSTESGVVLRTVKQTI